MISLNVKCVRQKYGLVQVVTNVTDRLMPVQSSG